jgi:arylsulfatase A-like enzyme
LQTAVIPGTAGYGLDPSEYLMPQTLKDAGYKTAIIGKWHLGHADLKYWPRQRGFDYAYGATIGELDYYTHGDAGVLDWFRDNKPVHEDGYIPRRGAAGRLETHLAHPGAHECGPLQPRRRPLRKEQRL